MHPEHAHREVPDRPTAQQSERGGADAVAHVAAKGIPAVRAAVNGARIGARPGIRAGDRRAARLPGCSPHRTRNGGGARPRPRRSGRDSSTRPVSAQGHGSRADRSTARTEQTLRVSPLRWRGGHHVPRSCHDGGTEHGAHSPRRRRAGGSRRRENRRCGARGWMGRRSCCDGAAHRWRDASIRAKSAARHVGLYAVRGAVAGGVGVAAAGIVSAGMAASGLMVLGAPVAVPLATMLVVECVCEPRRFDRRFDTR